jgi:hypothetical protein
VGIPVSFRWITCFGGRRLGARGPVSPNRFSSFHHEFRRVGQDLSHRLGSRRGGLREGMGDRNLNDQSADGSDGTQGLFPRARFRGRTPSCRADVPCGRAALWPIAPSGMSAALRAHAHRAVPHSLSRLQFQCPLFHMKHRLGLKIRFVWPHGSMFHVKHRESLDLEGWAGQDRHLMTRSGKPS